MKNSVMVKMKTFMIKPLILVHFLYDRFQMIQARVVNGSMINTPLFLVDLDQEERLVTNMPQIVKTTIIFSMILATTIIIILMTRKNKE